MKRHFKSGMLQSWNKFCFTGGIIEVDVQFPGTIFCPCIVVISKAVGYFQHLHAVLLSYQGDMMWEVCGLQYGC